MHSSQGPVRWSSTVSNMFASVLEKVIVESAGKKYQKANDSTVCLKTLRKSNIYK